ncbi:MAG: TolB family protein, partial [Longimicrobiales bacterium]
LVFASYSDAEGGQMYVVDPDGDDLERITTEAAFYTQPVFSPDGARVVAIRGPRIAYEEALTQGVPRGSVDLVWVPSSGGEASLITPV